MNKNQLIAEIEKINNSIAKLFEVYRISVTLPPIFDFIERKKVEAFILKATERLNKAELKRLTIEKRKLEKQLKKLL